MAFAENLCRLQAQAGESNYRLAKSLGIHGSSVANWKSGRNLPLMVYRQKLAAHYGCTVDDLMKEADA